MLKREGLALKITIPFACLALALAMPGMAAARPVANPAPAAGSPAMPDSVIYEIRRGENLYTLAERYLDRIASYRTVQRLNRIADPRVVPVGTRLRIPLAILRAEPLRARILAMRGTVRIREGGRVIDAQAGTELPQGTVIETGKDGFISLGLPNGSRTSLPTLSRLSIVHLRRFVLTRSIDYDFTVEAGKADTHAAPLGSGNGLFRIRTERAVAAVRGTQFRVGVADAASLTEVLEGTVAAGASGQPPEAVSGGFGAVIAGGRVTREALLTAPALLAPGRVQVDPLVRLSFEPVAGSASYHLLVATDASMTDVIAEARSPAPDFTLSDIPNGRLFVRGSAIAASGLEGMAQTYAMRRVLTGLAASASADADRVTFKWSGSGEGRRLYRFQLLRNAPQGNAPQGDAVVDEPGLEDEGIALRALEPGTYYWRVGVRQFADGEQTENWLPFEKIIIAAPER